jgi:amino acid transporter
MPSRLRRAPILRSRSNLQIGSICASGAVLFLALLLSVFERKYTSEPSSELLVALAGVSATLFVAYSVVASNVVRDVRSRDRELEYRLGALVGIGICAVIGIGVALILTEASRPLDWPHQVALCWAGSSAVLLATAVAISPMVTFENARARHINPDE